jgi:hypothetical protein
MNRLLSAAAFGLIVAAIASISVPRFTRADDKSPDGRVFELRTYTTNDGKLDELHKRFRDHTNKLFVKHGMDLIGYWTPADGPEADNTLVYLLAFPSRDAREKSWQAFRDDPDWQAAYKASTAGGRLVKQVKSQFLNPTDYSPIK